MRVVRLGALAAALVLAGAGYLYVGGERIHAATTQLDPPTLTVVSSTATSISIHVCAGASGASAGFSIQWKTAADYAANGFASDVGDSYGAASFSGTLAGSSYSLAPFECVTVVPGAFSLDIGFSGDVSPLACGTEYVFRSFAHNNGTSTRSDFSSTYFASTAACNDGCTLAQGFWKNHPDAWPVSSLTLGTSSYTMAELLAILDEPVGGNGLIALARQLIAAKLNVASGANPSAISSAIAAADALIDFLVVPPVGAGTLRPSVTGALVKALNDWNTGVTGVGASGGV
jgi:hypothetical protein